VTSRRRGFESSRSEPSVGTVCTADIDRDGRHPHRGARRGHRVSTHTTGKRAIHRGCRRRLRSSGHGPSSGADRSICDELRVRQNVRMLEGLNIAVGLLGVIATLFSTLVGIRQMRYQGRTLAPAAPPASFIALCCSLASALLIEAGDAQTQAQSIVNTAGGVLSTTSVVCAVAVIVLLALPRSHPYTAGSARDPRRCADRLGRLPSRNCSGEAIGDHLRRISCRRGDSDTDS